MAELLAGRPPAASNDLATTMDGVGKLRFDFGALFGGVQRSHLGGRIRAAAKLQPLCARRDLVDERVCNAVKD